MTGRLVTYLAFSCLVALLALSDNLRAQGAVVAFGAIAAVLMLGLLMLDTLLRPEEPAPETDTTPDLLPTGFGRTLIEKLPTALVVVDDNGRVAYANPAAQTLLPHLEAGNHFANLVRAPRFVEAVNATMADQQDRTATFDLSGSGRLLGAQVTYLPPGTDVATGGRVIVQFEDLTEFRRADEMRKDFIANASHELRTPLASIIGYIETLRGHAKDDPEAQDRFLGIMETQAGRMHRLVEDLMSLSRIEMRSHIPPDETLDLFDLVRDAAAALEPVADKAGCEIVVDLPDDEEPMVTGVADELTQVATNLIDNAIKYGGGGGDVRILKATPNEKYPRMIGVSIIDKGDGINRENLHRLTERFYRVNASDSKNRGGTGLGLAIVKHVMNHHGGALQIASSPGDGSVFTFWTPLSQNPVELAKKTGQIQIAK